MRVRVLKDFVLRDSAAVKRIFHAGDIAEIDPKKDGTLLRTGFVMQEKSLDGAKKTKVESTEAGEPEEIKGQKVE